MPRSWPGTEEACHCHNATIKLVKSHHNALMSVMYTCTCICYILMRSRHINSRRWARLPLELRTWRRQQANKQNEKMLSLRVRRRCGAGTHMNIRWSGAHGELRATGSVGGHLLARAPAAPAHRTGTCQFSRQSQHGPARAAAQGRGYSITPSRWRSPQAAPSRPTPGALDAAAALRQLLCRGLLG